MSGITVIVVDNGMYSQNQDYIPNRLVAQKDLIDGITTRIFEKTSESLIGIIAFAQKEQNNILTPTGEKKYILEAIDKIDIYPSSDYRLAFFQANNSLFVKDKNPKAIICFICSYVENIEETFMEIFSLAENGFVMKYICFGDGVELGKLLYEEINLPNFHCLVCEDSINFEKKVMEFLNNGLEMEDPELEEAIRRSLMESK